MMLTLNDIRRELVPRWEHVLPLVDEIQDRAFFDSDYDDQVNLWLSGEKSTVHLRDVIVEPLRCRPKIMEIGKRFSPSTRWHNTWMPLDTAAHLAKQRKLEPEPVHDPDLRALPFFGMF